MDRFGAGGVWSGMSGEEGDGSPVFPVQPPSTVLRTIAWLFVSLFAVVLGLAIFLPFPETVNGSFVVFPEAGLDPVLSPCDGRIEGVPVKEGELVRKGDVLFLIRSKEITQRVREYRTAEQDLVGLQKQRASFEIELQAHEQAAVAEMERLTLRRDQLELQIEQSRNQSRISQDYFDSSMEIQKSKIEQSAQEAKFYEENFKRYDSILKKFETLLSKDFISKLDYIVFQIECSKASLNAKTAQWQQRQAGLSLKKMRVDRRKEIAEEELRLNEYLSEHAQVLASIERSKNEIEARRANLSDRLRAVDTEIGKSHLLIESLKSQLSDSDMSELKVTSPYEGIVLDLTRHNPGDVVLHGQSLCEVASTQGPFYAEIRVPEKSIAKVSQGQPVKLLFTAYPYQRYGIRRGLVRWVSPGTVTVDGRKEFLAFSTLPDDAPAGLADGNPIRPGMKGEARIIVGTRTLMESVFEPLRALKENMSGGKRPSG